MSDAIAWWKNRFGDEIKRYVLGHGTKEIDKFFKKKLDSWKHVKVKIAITGDAGAGKSSFINKLLGLKKGDEGAAKVGFRTDCTYEPQRYPHPKNDNVELWDLPGIGTDEFSQQTYWQRVNLEKYDTFLIFTATRFRREVSYLTKEITKIGKKFFFVRSKIDLDVQDLKEDDDASSSKEAEEALFKDMRSESRTRLGDQLSINQDIYLISNKYPEKWDFARLAKDILLVLPEDLSDCLAFSLDILRSLSADTLKCKVNALKKRMILVAGASAASAAVPIPLVSAAADAGLIANELALYRSQLGLPSEETSFFKTLTATTQAKVKSCLSLLDVAFKGAGWLTVYATESAAEQGVRFIPFIGLAMASAMSFGATYYALKTSLETMEEAALAVIEETDPRK